MNQRNQNMRQRAGWARHKSLRQLLAKIICAILTFVSFAQLGNVNLVLAQNVTPTLSSLNPSTVKAGSESFTLMLTGANFKRSSSVRWNGAERATNFLSGSQLSISISKSDIAVQGIAMLQVFDPATGSKSNALPFIISGSTPSPPSAAPTLTTLNPSTVKAGSEGFPLMVTGANFNRFSVVKWNGAERPTNFISSSQLSAQIDDSDFALQGVVMIQVSNANSGSTSNTLPFIITGSMPPPPPPPPPPAAPVIAMVNPNPATAGARHFKLIVTGRNFDNSSVVRWNGSNRLTIFMSATELRANIPATDIQTVGAAAITVLNGNNLVSNPLTFSIIAPATPPTVWQHPALASITSSIVAQGARHIKLTLSGANFKRGARLLISASQENPSPDINLESLTRINDNLLTAVISVSHKARLGERSIDVVNADGTNTGLRGSNTSKKLRVVSNSSLAAPLSIHTAIITHPRNATVAAQGEELFAEAILGGVGTGTVTGEWLWDGKVFEQFAKTMTGGERLTVKTNAPLPTLFLGLHKLELRITSASELRTQPIEVIVNPGTWRLMKLLAPASQTAFVSQAPPMLRWAIVPGAARYQVGFSTAPFFHSIDQWYDVEDSKWQVPEAVWKVLREGEIYWTVRAVEASGEARQPALMRRIIHGERTQLNAGLSSASAEVTKDGKQTIFFAEKKNQNTQNSKSSSSAKADAPLTDAEPEQDKNKASSVQPTPSSSAPTEGAPVSDEVTDGAQANSSTAEGEQAESPFHFQLASNSEAISGSEGETNVVSVAAQMNLQRGTWRFEMNGSGAMNSLLSVKPRHLLGRFDDYLFRATREQQSFGTDLRFGILTPAMYANSEFLNPAFPQQGFEGMLKTHAGCFAVYSNARGQGESPEVRQRLQGASYAAPIPKERATFRLMVMRVREITKESFFSVTETEPVDLLGFNAPKKIDALGALLIVPMNQQWNWTTEYAVTADRSGLLEQASQGRALRTGIGGIWQKTTLNLSYREVTPQYVSPVGAALNQLNNSDRRGIDASVIEQTTAGAFLINYQFLQSDLRSQERPVTALHNLALNWSKNLNKHTSVALGGNLVRTRSGEKKGLSRFLMTQHFSRSQTIGA